MFGRHGLPLSLYTDRGSPLLSYARSRRARWTAAGLTQVGRALEHLGVEHIAAYSPQARGRSERVFQTLQDRADRRSWRWPGSTTVERCQRVPARRLYPRPQRPFRRCRPSRKAAPSSPSPASISIEILCVQEERDVGNDNCVSLQDR